MSKKDRILIIRLSSLGDVILATSAVSALPSGGVPADWLTRQEYAAVLEGHPRLSRVWSFARASGLRGWIAMCREVFAQDYTAIYDLQSSLRTRLMRALFFGWSLRRGSRAPTWRVFKKPRIRAYGYYILKRSWPVSWRPEKRVVAFARLVGGTGRERPDLTHLLTGATFKSEKSERSEKKRVARVVDDLPSAYLAVMPDSLWEGKRWAIERYLEVIRNGKWFPVVLGTDADTFSLELVARLSNAQVPHYNGVGRLAWTDTAAVLAGAQAYLGGDTGLAHLAEAVGTPALVIFGPTAADAGFGPWRASSQAVGSALGCRPCGKDGRYCYRFWNRYQCMKEVSPTQVEEALRHAIAAK